MCVCVYESVRVAADGHHRDTWLVSLMDVSCYWRLSSLKPLDSSSWEMSSYERSYRLAGCTSRDGNERFTSSREHARVKAFRFLSCACRGKQGTRSQKAFSCVLQKGMDLLLICVSVPTDVLRTNFSIGSCDHPCRSAVTSHQKNIWSTVLTVSKATRETTICINEAGGLNFGYVPGPHDWPQDIPRGDHRQPEMKLPSAK